jgi:hypothetical protein
MKLIQAETQDGFAYQYDVEDVDQKIYSIPVGFIQVEAWLNGYARFTPFLDYIIDSEKGEFIFNNKCLSYTCHSELQPCILGDSITLVGYNF